MKKEDRYALVDGMPTDILDPTAKPMSGEQVVSKLNGLWRRLEDCREMKSYSIDERLLALSATKYECRKTDLGFRWFALGGDDPGPVTNLELHDTLTAEALRRGDHPDHA